MARRGCRGGRGVHGVQSRGCIAEGAEVPQPLEPTHEELHHPLFREPAQQLVPVGLGAPGRRVSDLGWASQPRYSLPLGPERLNCSSQVRSAAKPLASQPQDARTPGLGTAKTAHPTCCQAEARWSHTTGWPHASAPQRAQRHSSSK